MAKLTRKTQKVFASSAGATGIVEYGTPASGSSVYSTDPDDIQTPAWESGWSAAALSGNEIPTFQDFNGIHNVTTRQIGYVLQEGIAEYDSGTEYHENSIVKKTGTLELYSSLTNSNTGNALPSQTDNTDWKYIGDLAGGIGGADASETVKGVVEIATDAEFKAGTDVGSTGAQLVGKPSQMPFKGVYDPQTENTITTGGLLTLAHGLGYRPSVIIPSLKCKVSDGNWAVNDIVMTAANDVNGNNMRSAALWADATNVYVRFGNYSPAWQIPDKTTGNRLDITNSRWRLLVTAF